MRPSMFMAGSGVKPAQYIGGRTQPLPAGAGAVPLSTISGIAVGDYVFITGLGRGTSYFTAPAGWEVDNYAFGSGNRSSVMHRRVASLDAPIITNPSATQAAGIVVAAYRGASKASRLAAAQAYITSPATLVLPGATRKSDGVGMFTVGLSGFAGNTSAAPTGAWVRRNVASFAGPNITMAVADALPRSDYADNAPVTWADLGDYSAAMLYEMRL